jgi:hypothetical protein
MPALKKPSRQSIETYQQCVKANGCVGATVAKVDNGAFPGISNRI